MDLRSSRVGERVSMQFERPNSNILRMCYMGDFEAIAQSKEYCMSVNGFKELLKEFPRVLDCSL